MNKEKDQIYKCSICGNVVELTYVGGGELVCCGQPMELLMEKSEDTGSEKHVPIIMKTGNGFRVKVGSVPHPMEEKHYIVWIEILADGRNYRKYLNPGEAPEADFCLSASKISARAYCNIHGLWRAV